MIDQQTKESHYKSILNALNRFEMHSLLIAMKTGLSQHQISRRMKELINMGKVEICGTVKVNRNGKLTDFTKYKKIWIK